jgi:pyruvate,water dikinase
MPSSKGIQLAALPADKSTHPPLTPQEVDTVFQTALEAEIFFKMPQDVEWTYDRDTLTLLQSRPITTLSSNKAHDERGWYLSLHRSFDNLKSLRAKIEKELIPGMIAEAENLKTVNLERMPDQALADEIRKRLDVNHKWVNIYWADFIPYAHGVRLFGQVYNDAVRPEDPYEFMDLLTSTEMASLERNKMLMDLAAIVRKDAQLAKNLKRDRHDSLDVEFTALVKEFIEKFGDLSCAVTGGKDCVLGTGPLYSLLLELARHPAQTANPPKKDRTRRLIQKYLDHFEENQKTWAEEVLDLARNSYQLRDDDNIYLGRIEAQLLAAVQEAKKRLESRTGDPDDKVLRHVLDKVDFGTEPKSTTRTQKDTIGRLQARQLTGQPAGPGISKGHARVIHNHSDLAKFKHGEVLVCDAVDPNITFVVPLASAVVERRGGMLIHGAIIAREYGLPCITGVPDATILIRTGDKITVDGYLGIVTIGDSSL